MLRTTFASIVTTLAVLAAGTAHAQWGYPTNTYSYPAASYPAYNSYSTYYAPATSYPAYGNCPNGNCYNTYGRATSYYVPAYGAGYGSNCPNGNCGTQYPANYSSYYAPATTYPAYNNCPNGNCYQQQPAYRGYAPVYYPVGGSTAPAYSAPSATTYSNPAPRSTTSNYGPSYRNIGYEVQDGRSGGYASPYDARQNRSPFYE